ncbi:hypothetical protein RAA17_00865 [Komagataeibacter rhaeticus]|nr:hypothetical protein [Komagataeibacter rhaeticus]
MQDTDGECITAEQKSQAALTSQWARYDSDLKGPACPWSAIRAGWRNTRPC